MNTNKTWNLSEAIIDYSKEKPHCNNCQFAKEAIVYTYCKVKGNKTCKAIFGISEARYCKYFKIKEIKE